MSWFIWSATGIFQVNSHDSWCQFLFAFIVIGDGLRIEIFEDYQIPRKTQILAFQMLQRCEDLDCIVFCALVSENVNWVHWLVKSIRFKSLEGWCDRFVSWLTKKSDYNDWCVRKWVVMGSISANLTQGKNALHGYASCWVVGEFHSCLGRYDSMDGLTELLINDMILTWNES